MKIRAILALAVAMAGLALAGPAATAVAAPVAYPPTICPTLSVSTTTPAVGETITVTGINFDPNAHIRIELHTKIYVLANVVSDASGAFSTPVTMPPGVTGNHLIFAVGGGFDTAQCPPDPIQIQVGVGPTSSSAHPGPNPPPAITGFDILALIVGAAALLGVGLALNRGGKRRRAASHRV